MKNDHTTQIPFPTEKGWGASPLQKEPEKNSFFRLIVPRKRKIALTLASLGAGSEYGCRRTNWPGLMALMCMKHTDKCTDRVKARGASASGWHHSLRTARSALAQSPRAAVGPAPPLLFPSPAVRAEHCGTQTKCPQTGWSETSGYGGAGPHARCGGSPSQPPLPSPRSLSPSPPRPAGPARAVARPRQPPPTAARAQRAGPLAPPLGPTGAGRSSSRASHSRTSRARG